MKKIIFVSHCILNTASKVVLYNQQDIDAEEDLRLRFVSKALNAGVQFVQLPCPEFTLYGSRRWGHVSNQFDNPFFRQHCRKILKPIIQQLKEYLSKPSFEVLGIVGIDGSPSCGVDYTCEADWYGAFDGREGLEDTLKTVKLVSKHGVFMDELESMLKEEGLTEKVPLRSLFAPEPEKCLSLIK
jgi:predicted secreted protein